MNKTFYKFYKSLRAEIVLSKVKQFLLMLHPVICTHLPRHVALNYPFFFFLISIGANPILFTSRTSSHYPICDSYHYPIFYHIRSTSRISISAAWSREPWGTDHLFADRCLTRLIRQCDCKNRVSA